MTGKGIIFILTVCFFSLGLNAQINRPIINALSKYSAGPGEEITINGANFVANSEVSFGAASAAFAFVSSTQITATVPTNATYDFVNVTNLDNGLTGSSSRQFMMSFGGDGFESSKVDAQESFSSEGQTLIWDLCLCDLDEDDNLDAVTTYRETTGVNVYRNNSTINSTVFSFNTTLSAPTDRSNYITCDDLDGDGKKDIVITSNATTLFSVKYFRNNSSPGIIDIDEVGMFSLPKSLENSNRSSFSIKLADIDGDGKKDLIVGNDTDPNTLDDAKLFIYLNTSSIGNISFKSTPEEIQLPEESKSSLTDVGELNGDNLPDLITANYGAGSIYVFKNQSTPGSVKFEEASAFDSQASDREGIIIADFNNDGLGDLAHANEENGNVVIYTNTTPTASGDISFSLTKTISISSAAELSAGDLDGDGLVDIAIATLINNGIKVLENITSNGTIDFESPVDIEVERNASNVQKSIRNIQLADVNGDAKPDFVFTFNSQTGLVGELSVIPNRNCISPSIIPSDITFCNDIPFTLTASKTFGVSYSWSSPNAPLANFVPSGRDVEVTIPSGSPSSVQITLKVTSDDGFCTDAITQTYSINSGSSPAAPTITNTNSGVICGGEAFTLGTSTTGDSYQWILPDGSTLSSEEVIITSARSENAGLYSLRVQEAGGCFGEASEINIDIDTPPSLTIINQDGDENFCETSSGVTLEVPDFNGFSLAWLKDGSPITGAANSTLDVVESGRYSVNVTSASSCVTQSEAYEVFAIAEPSAMINADAAICVDLPLDFEATSTGATGFAMTHTWDFDDGNTATGLSVTNTFASSGTYTVALTSSYDDVDVCEDVITLQVIVSDVPEINITNTTGMNEKCPSDSVFLTLPSNYQSYLWSTGDTGDSTYAKTSDSQNSVTISADVVTEIGCVTTTQEITISNYANSGITISAAGFTNDNDTIELELGVKSVLLTAFTSGGNNYIWNANDLNILSTTSGDMTEVFPKEAFTTVTVSATDINSCNESQSIVIQRPGLQPGKAFSPNGDMQNDCWEIINSEDQSDCSIIIFDTRGSTVFEGTSPFLNNCVWNGQLDGNGGDVAEGVYFFVLKCDDKSSSQTGSILLAR
ncbi:MAG: VCBS repeat-containing protein [Cyclobacteriaceae bacterium]